MRRLAGMAIGCALLSSGVAHAQFGRGSGWGTSGGDAQRSSWVRADAKISKDSLAKPGFAFLWKIKLPGEPNRSSPIASPLILEGYIGYRGFRSLGFVSNGGDHLVGIDTDLGRIEWTKHASSAPVQSGPCANITASITRSVTTAFPPSAPAGRGGGGRGGAAAHSGVGKPNEGAVTIQEIAAAAARAGRDGAPGGPGGPGRGGANAGRGGAGRGAPGGGPGRQPLYLHVLSSDGMFHNMYVSNAEEPEAGVKFLPPGANAQGLIVVDNVAYAATTGGCGGAPDSVWALDLASKEVTSWKPASGGIAGSAGPAIAPDGTLYVATASGDLVSLEPKTLKVKDAIRAGQGFTASPVIFEYKDKSIVAAPTKDGRVHLFDTKDLGGSPADSKAPGSLASWQDAAGTRWILGSTASSIVAWKLAGEDGALTLQPGWSHDLASPTPPMILNGVVFAASGSPAVLYALDAGTGKELWNSGKTITSAIRGGSISGGGTQVYLGTNDGTFYAFGFPIEH